MEFEASRPRVPAATADGTGSPLRPARGPGKRLVRKRAGGYTVSGYTVSGPAVSPIEWTPPRAIAARREMRDPRGRVSSQRREDASAGEAGGGHPISVDLDARAVTRAHPGGPRLAVEPGTNIQIEE